MSATPARSGAYVGDGGILMHLTESKPGQPANEHMAKQLAKGTLRPASVPEAAGEAPSRPATSATVAQWREWAIGAGLPAYEVEGMSKKAILLWADPDAESEGDE